MLFSLPSGMDFRYSVSPRWAMPTPAIWPSFTMSTACFFHNGIVGKLIPSDLAAFVDKTDDPLCVGICLRNLIQGLLHKFLPKIVFVHIHRSFCVVFATEQRICGFTN